MEQTLMKALSPLLLLLLLLGCDMNTDDVPDGHPTITEYYELSNVDKLIAIPYPPISVQWLSTSYKNMESSNIQVLLEFSIEDKQAILEQSQDFGDSYQFRISMDTIKWLPDKAIAGISFEPYIQEVQKITGSNAHTAELFILKEYSAYIHGSIVPLNGGYILLRLCAS